MKTELAIKIDSANSGLKSFDCEPFFHNNTLYFAYPYIDRGTILPNGKFSTGIRIYYLDTIDLSLTERSINFTNNEPYKFKITDSDKWRFTKDDSGTLLDIGFYINVDTLEVVALDRTPKQAAESKEGIHYNDFVVEYNGKSTITCTSRGTGEVVWKIKLIGYLYTGIERKDNTLFWGTAGKGGGFYAVDLASGNILTLYKNGDASNYTWYGENVLLRTPTGNLSLLNPYTSQEVDTLKLMGKMMSNRISVIGNRALVFTHDLKGQTTYFNWVQLA